MQRKTPRLTRRQLLTLMGAGAATLVAGCSEDENPARESDDPTSPDVDPDGPGNGPAPAFLHGVASGDPLPTAVVIWTRVTPVETATPGANVVVEPLPVQWEVADNAGFAGTLRSGSTMAVAEHDYTVHVDVTGLDPDRSYWYRFRSRGVTSPAGRTKTAPAASSTRAVRFGVVSCAEWEFGFFGAYGRLAERNDLDAIIHLGDYIYEFGTSYGPVPTPGAAFDRVHEPPREVTTLADYRQRYGQYHSDPSLQALHARYPFITTYDDHEVANDWWREGAENHDASEGDFLLRLASALRAWREWQPLRLILTGSVQAWRKLQYGRTVDLWMLDTRLYRDQQPDNAIVGYGSVDPATDDPSRTLLGATQKQWLFGGLPQSTATWKVLGNQVPFYPFVLGVNLPDALQQIIDQGDGTLPPLPATLTVEDWNGYRAEQQALIKVMDGVDDVVVLTGDYHESFAAEVPLKPGDYALSQLAPVPLLDARTVAVEFICPAVTSPGLTETLAGLGLPGDAPLNINTVFEANLTLANPWVKYHEGFRNGYGVVEFAATQAQYDFWHVDDRTDPDTAAAAVKSFRVVKGSKRLVAVTAPLS